MGCKKKSLFNTEKRISCSNNHLEATFLAGRFFLANWVAVGFINVELFSIAGLKLEFKLLPVALLPEVCPRKEGNTCYAKGRIY